MRIHLKKTLCLIITALFIFLILPYSADITASSFSGKDSHNGYLYYVEQGDFSVSIRYNNTNTKVTIDDQILNTACFDRCLTLLCTTKDFNYSVYTYDTDKGSLDYYVTELSADLNSPVFACDKHGNICILNNKDKRIIDIITNGTETSECLPSVAYQLMYTGSEDFLVFAADGVYSLDYKSTKKISDTVPATPCSYSTEGLITDAMGNLYTYSNKEFRPYEPETTSVPLKVPESIKIVSDLIYIEQGTTFAGLYKAFGIDKSQLFITKPDGKSITSGKLGTGMTSEFAGNIYTIAIPGDLTGEGNINSRDLKTLMKHLSGEILLRGAFMKAADTYIDSEINTKDLLKLSNMY